MVMPADGSYSFHLFQNALAYCGRLKDARIIRHPQLDRFYVVPAPEALRLVREHGWTEVPR